MSSFFLRKKPLSGRAGGAVSFCCSFKNARHFGGKLTVRSQFQVLPIGCGAIWRENDFVRFRIDDGFLGESLGLDVIEDGLIGIGLDCLIGGIHLRRSILLLKEDDGLVGEVDGCHGRIGPGGGGKSRRFYRAEVAKLKTCVAVLRNRSRAAHWSGPGHCTMKTATIPVFGLTDKSVP